MPFGRTPTPHSSDSAAANVPPSQPPRCLSQTPPPPYYPATHLVARSLLTASQLVSQFEDFSNHLRYVSDAPGLVFERLVANLNEAFNAAIELERHQHDAALQTCYEENKTLRLSNDKLSEKLSEFGETVTGGQVAREAPKSVHQNPAVGEFSTIEVRGWDQEHAEICKVVPFTSPYPMPPGIPVGLKSLDIYHGTNPRVKAYTSGIENDHFDIHIDSWGNTILYAAGCTWLEIGANDPDFQFGSYNTLEDPPSKPPKPHNERKIAFQRPYTTPPYVVVWLSGFDLGKEAIFRIRTYATNITTTGFTIHIDTWGDSVLNSGIATWVAYPVDKPGVFSGHFSALDLNAEKCSLSYNMRCLVGVFLQLRPVP